MKSGPLKRCQHAQLIRRGGNRRYGRLSPPQDVDGAVRRLRDQTKLEEEHNRVPGETRL